jgi:hypothetical protein
MLKSKKSVLACLMRHKGHTFLAIGAALLAFMLAVTFPSAVSQSQEPVDQEPEELIRERLKEQIKLFSTIPSMILAEELGVKEIEGRPLDGDVGDIQLRQLLEGLSRSGLPRGQMPNIADNVPISASPIRDENEPTVVANPQDENKLVAGSHFFPSPTPPSVNRCVAYTSSDGGQSWSDPILMPHLNPASSCSDPVLAYAPDGNRVYYAYMDIKSTALGGMDIVVSYSDDDGQNWTGPIIALDAITTGPVQFNYDKPWIGTHVDVPGSQFNNNFVYVTATQFRITGPVPDIAITFTRSLNQGLAWPGPVRLLDAGFGSPTPLPVVQGSRPIGGLGNNVLVAWYNSGRDGWGPSIGGGGEFEIRTAFSPNAGVTFGPSVVAATDSFETPFFLGPLGSFYRWWFVMNPDVEIDIGGTAHIVYAHDPEAGSATAEDGDIRYISSAGPPYTVWTAPVTISDDPTGQAQGFPTLETIGRVPHVIYEDHRLSPFPPAANILYDIFYTLRVGDNWEASSRVTSASSLVDRNFIGDYYDLTAGSSLIFGIWTDRRDKISIFDGEDDVWGARINSGSALSLKER